MSSRPSQLAQTAHHTKQAPNGRLDILDLMVREARDEVVLYHPLPLCLLELVVDLKLQLRDRLRSARRPGLLRGGSSRGGLCHGEGALCVRRDDTGYPFVPCRRHYKARLAATRLELLGRYELYVI